MFASCVHFIEMKSENVLAFLWFCLFATGSHVPKSVSIHYVNEDDLELAILKSPTLELQECNVPPCLAYAA